MKKLFSLILTVAVLVTALGVLGTTSVFAAAEPINLLVEANTAISGEGATFKYEDGKLIIDCTVEATGDVVPSIGISGPGVYDAATLSRTALKITADVPFQFAMYDAAYVSGDVKGKWIQASGDFFNIFESTPNEPIPAGAYDVLLNTQGCYTWNGDPLPETVEVTSIYIEPKGIGKITVEVLALTDENGTLPTGTAAPNATTTAANGATTTKAGATTTKAGATTTTATSSAPTGDVSNAIVFAVVACAAVAVVTLSVAASKKSKSR